MTTSNPAVMRTLEAAVDFTDNQWKVVYVDSDGKGALPTLTTQVPIGIAQNEPITGQGVAVAEVGGGGSSKCILGATLDEGVRVSLEVGGKVVAAASGSYPIGVLKTGGDEDDVGEVILTAITVDA